MGWVGMVWLIRVFLGFLNFFNLTKPLISRLNRSYWEREHHDLQMFDLKLKSIFLPGHGSETQLHLSENLDYLG